MATPNFNFSYLSSGQIGKEAAINLDLDMIDALLAPIVGLVFNNTHTFNSPPPTPLINRTYLISDTPSGIFSAYAGGVAIFTAFGWTMFTPTARLIFHDEQGAIVRRFGSTWIVGTSYVTNNNVPIFGSQSPFPTTNASEMIVGGRYFTNTASSLVVDAALVNYGYYEIFITSLGSLTLTAGAGISIVGETSFSGGKCIRLTRVDSQVFITTF
jgi:hypothetical protein